MPEAIQRIFQANRTANSGTGRNSPSRSKHVKDMQKYHQAHPPQKVPLPREVKREMIEELTGESFAWIEKLDLTDNYIQDLKPWDVDAETRALAELCLVLMNSNEFIYLR